MKKILITLIIGLVFVGCSKQIVPTTQQVQQPQQIKAEKPQVWKQSLYPQIVAGDPISFMNSTEIIMEGVSSDLTIVLKDGAIHHLDSNLTIKKTVDAYTIGTTTQDYPFKKSSNGVIQEMDVFFSLTDRTYFLNWRLKTDGSFTLNGNAKLFYDDKEYKVQAGTKGGECLLLVNLFTEKINIIVEESAEGTGIPSETKVIKIK